jgi:hypothetical protein
MEFMIGTGRPLKVTVNPGTAGKWPKEHVLKDVYAIGYEGGSVDVLVADDAGVLRWLKPSSYSVPSQPAKAWD